MSLDIWPIITDDHYVGYFTNSNHAQSIPIGVEKASDQSTNRDHYVKSHSDGPFTEGDVESFIDMSYPYTFKVEFIHTDG